MAYEEFFLILSFASYCRTSYTWVKPQARILYRPPPISLNINKIERRIFVYLPILEKSGQFLATVLATTQIEIFYIFFDTNRLDEQKYLK
jgi:hypothetical protein